MKKHVLTLGLLSSLVLTLSLTSCVKYGCTDEKADNYDAEAEDDDETCEYTADIIFYSDSARTRELFDQDYGAVLTIYVNDVEVGDLNYYNHLNAVPNCGDDFSGSIYEEALNYAYKMANPTEVVGVRVEDGFGNTFTRNLSVEAMACSPHRI